MSDIGMDSDVDIRTFPISEWQFSVRHICLRYRNNRCRCRISPILRSMSMPTYARFVLLVQLHQQQWIGIIFRAAQLPALFGYLHHWYSYSYSSLVVYKKGTWWMSHFPITFPSSPKPCSGFDSRSWLAAWLDCLYFVTPWYLGNNLGKQRKSMGKNGKGT